MHFWCLFLTRLTCLLWSTGLPLCFSLFRSCSCLLSDWDTGKSGRPMSFIDLPMGQPKVFYVISIRRVYLKHCTKVIWLETFPDIVFFSVFGSSNGPHERCQLLLSTTSLCCHMCGCLHGWLRISRWDQLGFKDRPQMWSRVSMWGSRGSEGPTQRGQPHGKRLALLGPQTYGQQERARQRKHSPLKPWGKPISAILILPFGPPEVWENNVVLILEYQYKSNTEDWPDVGILWLPEVGLTGILDSPGSTIDGLCRRGWHRPKRTVQY